MEPNTQLLDKENKGVSFAQLEELVGKKFDTLADVTAHFRSAKATDNVEKTANVLAVLLPAVTELSKAVTALKGAEGQDNEANAAVAVEAANIRKLFAAANTPKEKADILAKTAQEFGFAGVAALDMNRYRKAISVPTSPRVNKDYEERASFKACHDLAITIAALMRTSQPDVSVDGFDGQGTKALGDKFVGGDDLIKAGEHLVRQGVSGAEVWHKAVNDSLDSLTSGDGLEWVPTLYSSNLLEELWLDTPIMALFDEIYLPSPTYKIPVINGTGRAYIMDESLVPSDWNTVKAKAHTYDTADLSLTAKKLAVLMFYSREISEDSIVDVAQTCIREMLRGHAQSLDDLAVNGNRSYYNSRLDSALWSDTDDARYVNDGIRYHAHDITGNGAASRKIDSGGRVESDHILLARKLMRKWGVGNPRDTVMLTSPEGYVDLLGLPDAITWDKIGNRATILSGQVAELWGHAIIPSEFVGSNLNASGVYDGVTTTKTAIVLVNRRNYVRGNRRMFMLERQYQMLSGMYAALGTNRMDFRKVRMTAPTEAVIYNISSTTMVAP